MLLRLFTLFRSSFESDPIIFFDLPSGERPLGLHVLCVGFDECGAETETETNGETETNRETDTDGAVAGTGVVTVNRFKSYPSIFVSKSSGV